MLRGALAAAWLRTPGAPGPDDPTFCEVFEGDGSFGPLHSLDSPPPPLSAWVHKSAESCRRRWWDEVYDGPPPDGVCPDCRGNLERAKGQPIGQVPTVTRTRVALDLDGVAIDGNLFRRSALTAGTVLRGWVSGPAVDALTPGGRPITTVRFGGERSVRGLAQITVSEGEPLPVAETVGNDIILRLAGPGIFVDRFGLPTNQPGKAELKAVLGVKIDEVTPCATRWAEVGGWHMASGLPKPRERAAAPGSTYRIRCAEPPPKEQLSELMVRGIGMRRREGFGALGPRPRDWRSEAAPIVSWAKWEKAAPLFSARVVALGEGRADARLDKAPNDPTLTSRQRDALTVLLSITDGTLLATIVDGLPS